MRNKSKLKKRISLFILIILLVLSIYFLLKLGQIQRRIFIGNTINAQSINNKTVSDYLKSKAPFNILLLGYGGGNHDGAYLTDSMIIIHIDPANQKTTLISIPRDIWVKIPTNGDNGSFWKINAAYEIGLDNADYPNKQTQFKGTDGGGRLAEYVASQVTGLPIQYFIGMDFTGFKHTIDSLGGVDINVETAFTDPEYPVDGKENDLCGHPQSDLPMLEAEATQSAVETVFPCRYETLHFDQGLQHMDGERALSYVRSRHSLQDGTDFGRAKRQRNLLLAVKQKIFSIGFIPRIIPFISSLGDDLRTDMSSNDLQALIQNSLILNKYQVSTTALTNQNLLDDTLSNDGQEILVPKEGIGKWNSVHDFIASLLESNRQIISPVIKVENGTAITGLATLAYNRLQDKDFNVLPPSNSSLSLETTTITVYNSQINYHIIDDLKAEFGVSRVEVKKQPADQPYDILIILGKDYNLKQGKKLIN